MCAAKTATQKQRAPGYKHWAPSTGQAKDDLMDGAGNVVDDAGSNLADLQFPLLYSH